MIWFWKLFGRGHRALYEFSGGRVGARMAGIDIALVGTVGRRSGELRTVPIACYPYRDSVLVSASNGGLDRHPAWYLNMRQDPRVQVQLGTERFAAVAEELPPQEREAAWRLVEAGNPRQAHYRGITRRDIPLVWLRRSPPTPQP